ncbi:putative ATP-dependent RNA, partial [Tetrabaena socialis]
VDAGEVDREYERTLELATRRLKIEMPDSLRMEGTLAVHSPKFLALLQYLQGSPGPALVYSQFRRAEGLGLLASTLDVNGWVEFRLEDPECNRLLLNIFNNEFDQLPRATRDSLPTETNLHGECARVFMITASGAEGISLKNVRQVHMIEGFWNHNRLDQVIGRAVPARSHIDLPEAERHVDVFLYLSTFTDDQRLDHAIMHIDKGLTSDQYVHTVAMKKKHLTDQVLSLIRAASVDCAVHDKDEKACFNLPQTADGQERFRTTEFASDLDDAAYARRIVKLVVVSLDNQKFYLDRRAGILYDYDKLKAENVLLQ